MIHMLITMCRLHMMDTEKLMIYYTKSEYVASGGEG